MANGAVGSAAGTPASAHCLVCGYALCDLPAARCPECGQAFDPGDPQTFSTHRWETWLGRQLGRPPGVLLIGITVVVVLIQLQQCSLPPLTKTFPRTVATVWLAAVGLLWGVRFVARWDAPPPLRSRAWGRWLVGPVLLVGCWLLIQTDYPERIRFALSQGAFEAHVQRRADAGAAVANPGWLGLYAVTGVRDYRGGTIIFVNRGPVGHRGGYAYFPQGLPEGTTSETTELRQYYSHLTGAWYRCQILGALKEFSGADADSSAGAQ